MPIKKFQPAKTRALVLLCYLAPRTKEEKDFETKTTEHGSEESDWMSD